MSSSSVSSSANAKKSVRSERKKARRGKSHPIFSKPKWWRYVRVHEDESDLVHVPGVSSCMPTERKEDGDSGQIHSNPVITLSRSMLRSMGLGTRLNRIHLWTNTLQVAGGANTAINSSSTVTLTAATFPEVTQLLPVFEEVKAVSYVIHYEFVLQTSSSAASLLPVIGGAAANWDVNTAGPTALSSVLDESFCTGPLSFYPFNQTAVVSTLPHQRLNTLRFHAPNDVSMVTSSSVIGSNTWEEFDNTSPVNLFQLLVYLPAGGANSIVYFQFVVEAILDFRMRT